MLGANDGIVATASLIVGVAAASGPISNVLIAGVGGLVAVANKMGWIFWAMMTRETNYRLAPAVA